MHTSHLCSLSLPPTLDGSTTLVFGNNRAPQRPGYVHFSTSARMRRLPDVSESGLPTPVCLASHEVLRIHPSFTQSLHRLALFFFFCDLQAVPSGVRICLRPTSDWRIGCHHCAPTRCRRHSTTSPNVVERALRRQYPHKCVPPRWRRVGPCP